MIRGPIVRKVYWQIISVMACLVTPFANGIGCNNLELTPILGEYLVKVETSNLVGTWSDVYISSDDLNDLDASYSVMSVDIKDFSLYVQSKELVKNGVEREISYDEGIELGYERGTCYWTGKYDDGSKWERRLFLIYSDENVMAHYSCDSRQSLERGWDILIAIKSTKKSELVTPTTSPSDVQISLDNALEKLKKLKEKDEKYKKQYHEEFGFMGQFAMVDLKNLRP